MGFQCSTSESRPSAPLTPAPTATTVAPRAVLPALGDPGCRALLCAAADASTAKELAAACGLPSSTVYRKLDRLDETPLVERTARVRRRGKHPQQYRCRVAAVRVRVPSGDDDVRVSLVPRSPPEARER